MTLFSQKGAHVESGLFGSAAIGLRDRAGAARGASLRAAGFAVGAEYVSFASLYIVAGFAECVDGAGGLQGLAQGVQGDVVGAGSARCPLRRSAPR